MNWSAGLSGVAYFLLVADTALAVTMTVGLFFGELDDAELILVWLVSSLLAVFGWCAVLL